MSAASGNVETAPRAPATDRQRRESRSAGRRAEYWVLGVLKWGSIAFFIAITSSIAFSAISNSPNCCRISLWS